MDLVARRCGNCHHFDSHTLMPHGLEAGAWGTCSNFPDAQSTFKTCGFRLYGHNVAWAKASEFAPRHELIAEVGAELRTSMQQ